MSTKNKTTVDNNKNHLSVNLEKATFNGKQNKAKIWFIIGMFAIVPATLLIGLLVGYLAYFPHVKDSKGIEQGKFVVNEHIASFVIVMVMIAVIIAFMFFLFYALRKRLVFDNKKKAWTLASIGFVACFLDAIGVGAYAVTIGLMKATKTSVDDAKISGTLTVGYVLPELIEATIFMGAVQAEWETLLILTACSIVGGLIGSWLSNKINSQVFRFVISILMFAVGIIMILVNPNVAVIKTIKNGGVDGFLIGNGKSIGKLIGSIFIFIVLGILSSLGLGMYAPALAILTLLGMSTTAIFPVMAVAASAMMPPAAIKFIKDKNYLDTQAIIFNIVGGIGALVSFLVFFEGLQVGAGMNKDTFNTVLQWIATVVVFYCSGLMMYSFVRSYKKTGWKTPKADPDIL